MRWYYKNRLMVSFITNQLRTKKCFLHGFSPEGPALL